MLELIERLEKASGPDTWLDCNIREAVEGWKNVGGGFREWPDGRRERYDYGYAKPYTASIDAALTLVPNNWPIEKLSWWPKCPAGYEDQQRCWVTVIGLDHSGFGNPRARFDAVGLSPALALCIAALKARLSQSTH